MTSPRILHNPRNLEVVKDTTREGEPYLRINLKDKKSNPTVGICRVLPDTKDIDFLSLTVEKFPQDFKEKTKRQMRDILIGMGYEIELN